MFSAPQPAIFLDANASTPVLPSAKQAFLNALMLPGNASLPNASGRALRRVLDDAREQVAQMLGSKDKEIIFNSGASEGNRWLVDAIVATGRARGRPMRVVSSPLEHPSLANCLAKAAHLGEIELKVLPIDAQGALDFGAIDAAAEVVLVTAAHNETGILPDLNTLHAKLSDQMILIQDASQSIGRCEAALDRADAVVVSAHKIGGICGAGAMLLRGNARRLLAPWAGGGQEGGLRPGTEAVALVAAMGEASRLVQDTRQKCGALKSFRDEVEADLLKAWPFARVLGRDLLRLGQTSAISLSDTDGEALRIATDQMGICVGFGSACSALAPEPSPSLLAMGLDHATARATVRLSFYPDQDLALARVGIERLKAAVAQVR